MGAVKTRLKMDMHRQPDGASCGPTCLHAVYRFHGDEIALSRVVSEVVPLETGGTLAVLLATHALRRGYRATIYTYNLQLFDPTWFAEDIDIADKLRQQARRKRDPKLRFATNAYLDYLDLGGELRFEQLTPSLIRRYLKLGLPILTGLSATYLYESARECGMHDLEDDDVGGAPTGHFVVLYGYDKSTREVRVADPIGENPRYGNGIYKVGMQRLLGAILLGVLTYDANLLMLEPPRTDRRRGGAIGGRALTSTMRRSALL